MRFVISISFAGRCLATEQFDHITKLKPKNPTELQAVENLLNQIEWPRMNYFIFYLSKLYNRLAHKYFSQWNLL